MAVAEMPKDIGSAECGRAPEVWDRICTALVQHRRLFVFTDFDGTLSELVDIPTKAILDTEARRALRRLSHQSRVSLAVISGRSVDDVAARIGLPITYAGDHGLEIHTPEGDFVVPEADSLRRRLPELCNRIREDIQHIPGALVEIKRLSASVHYRQVEPEQVAELTETVRQRVSQTAFEVRGGNCVIEVRPRVNWGKGDAISLLLQRSAGLPEQAVCIGDDNTDEDMFESMPTAVNVRVMGDTQIRTAAPYCVRRTDVAVILHGIADIAEAIC